jgi:hypothetical protein
MQFVDTFLFFEMQLRHCTTLINSLVVTSNSLLTTASVLSLSTIKIFYAGFGDILGKKLRRVGR